MLVESRWSFDTDRGDVHFSGGSKNIKRVKYKVSRWIKALLEMNRQQQDHFQQVHWK